MFLKTFSTEPPRHTMKNLPHCRYHVFDFALGSVVRVRPRKRFTPQHIAKLCVVTETVGLAPGRPPGRLCPECATQFDEGEGRRFVDQLHVVDTKGNSTPLHRRATWPRSPGRPTARAARVSHQTRERSDALPVIGTRGGEHARS